MIKKYLSEYGAGDIELLFKDKHNCENCPFVILWTGKIPFACGDYHRFYCKLRYVFLSGVNLILGTLYSYDQLADLVNRIKVSRETNTLDLGIPDVLAVHPNNNNLYILSSLVVKSLDNCPIDMEKRGQSGLSDELKAEYLNWRIKYGKHNISIQDKALIREEQKKALQGRNK